MAKPTGPENRGARVALFVALAVAAAGLLTWLVLPAIWRIQGGDEPAAVRTIERPRPGSEPLLPPSEPDFANLAIPEPPKEALPLPPPLARMDLPADDMPSPPIVVMPRPAPSLPPPAGRPRPVEPPRPSFDFGIAPVQRAIDRALARGRAARWENGPASGYAVASEPNRAGGRECRNVYVTAASDGNEWRSTTWTYCRSGSGWERR